MYIVAVIQLNYTVFIKPRSNQIIINIFCTHNVTVVVYIFIYFIAAGTIAAIGCKWNKFPPPQKKKTINMAFIFTNAIRNAKQLCCKSVNLTI